MPIALSELRVEERNKERTTLYWRLADDVQVCGSKLRGRDPETRCNSPFVFPNGRCKQHGATAGRPPSSGRFARALPERIAAATEQWLEDEAALKDESKTMAVFAAIAERAAERASEQDTPEFRKRLRALYEAAQGDIDEGTSKSFDALGELLDQGIAEDKALAHLRSALQDFATRQDKSADRAVRREQVVTSKDLMGFTRAAIDVALQLWGATEAKRFAQAMDKWMGRGGA